MSSKDLQSLELHWYHVHILLNVCGQTLHTALTLSAPL